MAIAEAEIAAEVAVEIVAEAVVATVEIAVVVETTAVADATVVKTTTVGRPYHIIFFQKARREGGPFLLSSAALQKGERGEKSECALAGLGDGEDDGIIAEILKATSGHIADIKTSVCPAGEDFSTQILIGNA